MAGERSGTRRRAGAGARGRGQRLSCLRATAWSLMRSVPPMLMGLLGGNPSSATVVKLHDGGDCREEMSLEFLANRGRERTAESVQRGERLAASSGNRTIGLLRIA